MVFVWWYKLRIFFCDPLIFHIFNNRSFPPLATKFIQGCQSMHKTSDPWPWRVSSHSTRWVSHSLINLSVLQVKNFLSPGEKAASFIASLCFFNRGFRVISSSSSLFSKSNEENLKWPNLSQLNRKFSFIYFS